MDNSLNTTKNIPEPFVNLIMGPMFSGKTTKLIHSYNAYVKTYGKEKCIMLNYIHDKRYTKEQKVVSHDGLSVDCYDTSNLAEFIDNYSTQPIFLKAKYIFINEAQFFSNLIHLIIFSTKILNKNFVLCGLDYDYKKEKFGDLLNLVPYANNVHNLTGKCNTHNCSYPSKYSHRVINCEKQVLIGITQYVPLCEHCYAKNNTNISGTSNSSNETLELN
jgi:thymidine kinase